MRVYDSRYHSRSLPTSFVTLRARAIFPSPARTLSLSRIPPSPNGWRRMEGWNPLYFRAGKSPFVGRIRDVFHPRRFPAIIASPASISRKPLSQILALRAYLYSVVLKSASRISAATRTFSHRFINNFNRSIPSLIASLIFTTTLVQSACNFMIRLSVFNANLISWHLRRLVHRQSNLKIEFQKTELIMLIKLSSCMIALNDNQLSVSGGAMFSIQ